MPFLFEKLMVYQRALDVADEVIATIKEWPRGYGTLADQLTRATISVSTNLAEGNGRASRRDRKHFFIIARGSLQECVPLLDLAHRRGLIPTQAHDQWRGELDEIGRMIYGLVQAMDKTRSDD